MSPRTAERLATELGRGLVIWALFTVAGVGIVALPGARIISFSTGHGPSLVDTVGVVFLLTGWLIFVSILWRARSAMVRPRPLAGLALLGAVVVAWSVGTDRDSWWILGAGFLVLAQVVAAVSAMRRLRVPVSS